MRENFPAALRALRLVASVSDTRAPLRSGGSDAIADGAENIHTLSFSLSLSLSPLTDVMSEKPLAQKGH